MSQTNLDALKEKMEFDHFACAKADEEIRRESRKFHPNYDPDFIDGAIWESGRLQAIVLAEVGKTFEKYAELKSLHVKRLQELGEQITKNKELREQVGKLVATIQDNEGE